MRHQSILNKCKDDLPVLAWGFVCPAAVWRIFVLCNLKNELGARNLYLSLGAFSAR
ncbi:hypothetical protein AGR2A_pc0156 [Agrobacterium genomosp. 2 str. CFBP 5494]|uniref:Uncharacterized protein n=1 Tax=Agrobacterium genomosp. 2 str. CFBP 5494 TaxID=1183436 RepID=A0A9W5F3F5_9HYPH|nr:hypothetical protein AGR2A_pc0156 [Agrobacterium genomosp. 2 str. CFBP 5494]